MQFIKADYFKTQFSEKKFDGVITDIPYKGCISKKLGENKFSFDDFFHKTYEETKNNGFLITFCNFLCASDIMRISQEYGWKYHTYLIWNKLPTRNWIAWSHPLRHTEFILFLKKGKFKFSFKTGVEKPPYKRNGFGGSLKNQSKPNSNKKSYEMYSEIINLKIPRRNKIHPTQKPEEFSTIFSNIVGSDKFVLDPFVGSGSLLTAFDRSVGIDLVNYGNFTEYKINILDLNGFSTNYQSLENQVKVI